MVNAKYHLIPLPGYWEIAFRHFNSMRGKGGQRITSALVKEGFDLEWTNGGGNYGNLILVSHLRSSIMTIFLLKYSELLLENGIEMKAYAPNTKGSIRYTKER